MKKLFTVLLLFNTVCSYSQDIIFKKNGEEILAKVLEVMPDLVKYKIYTSQDGPTYSTYKSDILFIKYSDGRKDIFNEETNQTDKEPMPVKIVKEKQSENQYKTSTFVDTRDGQEYKTVKIGEQNWFAENLNYTSNQSWCYDNQSGYCDKYGRLYTYEAAINVCPEGWHLPTDEDWKELEVELGMKNGVDEEGWRGTRPGQGFLLKKGGGTGFDAELAGYRFWGDYNQVNKSGYYWSSSELLSNNKKVYVRVLKERASIKRKAFSNNYGFSVRCVKGDSKHRNDISDEKIMNKYLANKANKFISIGMGIGGNYGGFGIKAQGKIGNEKVGIALHTGFGTNLASMFYWDYADRWSGSAGLKLYYFKSFYINSFVSLAEGGMQDFIGFMTGTEIDFHRNFNIDLGVGMLQNRRYMSNLFTFNIGINYKIFK